MYSENYKSNKLILWIIFLISPFITFLISIKNFKLPENRIFILLFFTLLGYTFIPIAESDGDRYKTDYIQQHDYSFSQYIEDVQLTFKGKSDSPDYYLKTIKYVSFLFSSDYRVFFLLVGFFYYRAFMKLIFSVWNFTFEGENKIFIGYFLGCCFIHNLTAGLNGIRFPLAFVIFSYGALNLVLKENFKFLLIALSSVLIHFSLGFSCIFLMLFYLAKFPSNKNTLFLFLIITFLLSSIFPTFITTYISFFGDSIGNKVQTYSGDDFVELREEHTNQWNWYIKFNQFSTYYFCIISIILSKLKLFKLKFDENSNKLFGFSVIMVIHSLLSGSIVDSISNRYYLMVNLFGQIYLFYLSSINKNNKFINLIYKIFIPIMIINVLIIFRGDLYTISPILIFGNSISIFVSESLISIQQYILQ